MNKMLDTTFVPMLKKNNIYLNDDQFNAMIAFTYQFGENSWRDGETSTDSVRDFILSRNYSKKNLKAAFKPLMGAKALDGTVARLNDEIEMFLYGNYQRNYNYTRLN